jgi:hypothetical protein
MADSGKTSDYIGMVLVKDGIIIDDFDADTPGYTSCVGQAAPPPVKDDAEPLPGEDDTGAPTSDAAALLPPGHPRTARDVVAGLAARFKRQVGADRA